MLRRSLSLVLAAMCVWTAGCTRTQDVGERGPVSTTTSTTTAPTDVAAGADLTQIRTVVDQLLASNDVCAILTRRGIAVDNLDPTVFASTEARQAFTRGLISVMEHTIALADPSLREPLTTLQQSLVQVLDVIDRFADTPTAPDGLDAIQRIVDSPPFVDATRRLALWVTVNCR